MSKHISDQHRGASEARLREFARHEREQGVHPAIRSLRSRPKDRPAENRKLAEFARIERRGAE